MTGFSIKFLQRFILFNFILIGSIIAISYLKNIGITSQYSGLYWILHNRFYLENYIVNNEYFFYYLELLALVNSYIFIWSIRNYQYLNLPYSMGLYHAVKQFDSHDKKTKIHFDNFKKKKVYKSKNFSLFFKNWVSIKPEEYEKKKVDIAQYLSWDGDIKVYRNKRKGVELYFYKLPEVYHAYSISYKPGLINFGKSINGEYVIELNELTSMVIVGESGGGKSNFMHHLLNSFIVSIDLVEDIELIDLKGTELYIYHDHEKMNFIDQVEAVRDKLLVIKEIMNNRFESMKQNGEQLYSGRFHFIVIDEIGTIGTYPDKKLRDEIFNLMIEIAQKGRAAKVLLLIFAQKIDSSNIPRSLSDSNYSTISI